MATSRDFGPDLQEARQILTELQNHISAFDTRLLTFHAPIIDRTGGKWNQEEVLGYKKFIENVTHQSDVLDSVSIFSAPLPQLLSLNGFAEGFERC